MRHIVGLDAVVYRNRKHLRLEGDEETAQLILETGEVYFDDDTVARKHAQQLVASEARLGNISEVAELRDELIRLGLPASILSQKILYSGSHSGDFIAVNTLTALLNEIHLVRSTGKASVELQAFLDSVERLIRTATSEANPIVFV